MEELTLENLLKQLLKITEGNIKQDKREFVIYTIDEKDGIYKNLYETQQFDEACKEYLNKTICKK